MATTRRNLVIVRAGDSSLHPQWLQGMEAEERNWDLIINYFGDDPDKYRGGDWVRIDSKGPKWPALHDLIQAQASTVQCYDYVWLPDDDLACTCQDINLLFDICRDANIQLAQPSLTHDSYFSHVITLHSPIFRIRYTSFIEVMAPCFNKESLAKLLPTFNTNLSGWGLDYIWPSQLPGVAPRVAIVDQIQIRHTRPIGAANYKALQALGRTAQDELDEVLQKHGITKRHYKIRSAITRFSDNPLRSGLPLLFFYALGLLSIGPRLKAGWRSFPQVWLRGLWQQAH